MLNVINSFTIFGIEIKFYGLIMSIAMILGLIVACSICKRRDMKKDDIFILALYVLPLALIGARLYYVIFSASSYSFWEIFEVWKGGMAIYGGVIGGAVGVTLYCLIHKKNFFNVADIAATSLILGQAIGRIGCYFGGCCYGLEVTNPSFQWFPIATVQADGLWHLATFFYESFFDFIIFAGLFIAIKKMEKPGSIMALYLILYGTVRCVLETFRDTAEALFLGNSGIRVSQLLSALIVIAGVVELLLIYREKMMKTKKKG